MGILSVLTANPAQTEASAVLDPSLAAVEPVSVQQLANVADQIRRLTRDTEVLLVKRDKSDLTMRPAPGTWSVAECLDHLTQTTLAFLPAITKAIAEAPKLGANRPLRAGILANLLIRNLQPPYRIRLKVLPQLTPQNGSVETAWGAFVDSQSQLLETVLSTTGLAIDKVTIKSPVYARISYNIYGAFRMLAAHQSRHVWQIEQILNALDNRPASDIA